MTDWCKVVYLESLRYTLLSCFTSCLVPYFTIIPIVYKLTGDDRTILNLSSASLSVLSWAFR